MLWILRRTVSILSTQNTCFNWWIRKKSQFYTQKCYLTGPMLVGIHQVNIPISCFQFWPLVWDKQLLKVSYKGTYGKMTMPLATLWMCYGNCKNLLPSSMHNIWVSLLHRGYLNFWNEYAIYLIEWSEKSIFHEWQSHKWNIHFLTSWD